MKEIILLNAICGDAESYPAEVSLEEIADGENVNIEIWIRGKQYSSTAENYFMALRNLRIQMEHDDVQIVCNGAVRNVYPSAMMLRMGNGRKAYVLHHGIQARQTDIVDIFNTDVIPQVCSVNEQENYYREWLDSLKK